MEDKKKTYDLEELRKKYPRMGKKWDSDEDERLKKAYLEQRAVGFKDFDAFVFQLVEKFQRASGGLKARMAMHFQDVPGWDYGRQEQRTEELNKLAEEKLPVDKNNLLQEEYKKYLESKQETYLGFLKRLSDKLGGVEGRLLSHRLGQLLGPLEKYKRDNVDPYASTRKERLEQEVPHLDLSSNPQMQEALRIMGETGENLFLTGEAGTGKSTLLNYFRKTTKKNVVVLAPTGVAALNVEGQTIHSFCSFGPDITLSKVKKLAPFNPKAKLIKNLDAVVIDEISMVRADLLDFVDKFLRLNGPMPSLPFGGIQMVLIGDLYQLPPVDRDFGAGNGLIKEYASPYFFDSRAFKNSKFNFVELKTIYRQKDQVFKDVLNAVRNNAVSQEHLTLLNQRAQNQDNKFKFEKFAIYLTPTNNRARQVNNFFLERIPSELKSYAGEARGSFEDRELPTDLNLQIKIGAQIMMLNNDGRKRWVNGTMGKIIGIEKEGRDFSEHANNRPPSPFGRGVGGEGYKEALDEIIYFDDKDTPSDEDELSSDSIIVELETGEIVSVFPHTWEMFQFVLQRDTQKVDSKTTGTFTQYPFKLAWAVTIHKAQGKTFNKVYIDLATGTFAHGQLYVALSRCRTLEGLYLKRHIEPRDIILDARIVKFLENFALNSVK